MLFSRIQFYRKFKVELSAAFYVFFSILCCSTSLSLCIRNQGRLLVSRFSRHPRCLERAHKMGDLVIAEKRHYTEVVLKPRFFEQVIGG